MPDAFRGRVTLCFRQSLPAMLALAVLLGLAPARALAQTDEIQVYDGAIAGRGVINLTVHNNFTPEGLKTPAFPGGLIANHSWNGAFEWAYGVTPWFEAGLYLPLYTAYSTDRSAAVNGGKIRLLFAEPHADDHRFVYAVNFEFSYNSGHWDPRTYTSEIRPIFGLHLHSWDLLVNPILDNSWTGGFKSLDFAPASRVAYHLNPSWAVAVEEYDDFGPLRDFYPRDQQSHEIWGVFDRYSKMVDVEGGIGFGLTPGSDTVTLKLMLSRDIYHPKKASSPSP
ncbi:MAG TPA: hypothetical protein VJR26_14050 [Candidatus Acidoferrales bacterium]|nr:hypothetical protein [Candidatus Acidoferrales bacterium]